MKVLVTTKKGGKLLVNTLEEPDYKDKYLDESGDSFAKEEDVSSVEEPVEEKKEEAPAEEAKKKPKAKGNGKAKGKK